LLEEILLLVEELLPSKCYPCETICQAEPSEMSRAHFPEVAGNIEVDGDPPVIGTTFAFAELTAFAVIVLTLRILFG
jgi:hypothetical protein